MRRLHRPVLPFAWMLALAGVLVPAYTLADGSSEAAAALIGADAFAGAPLQPGVCRTSSQKAAYAACQDTFLGCKEAAWGAGTNERIRC